MRKTVDYSIELHCNPTLSEIVDKVRESLRVHYLYSHSEVSTVNADCIRLDYLRGYYDGVELVTLVTLPEPDFNWDKQVESYKRRLVEYGEWYNANRDAIEKELAEREAKRILDAKAEVKSKINQLEAKLTKLKSKQ